MEAGRRRVVIALACVLALDSADSATVGAVAAQLETDLHITNAQLGLLAAVPSFAAAIGTIPAGLLADRTRRTGLLAVSILLWGGAMFASGFSTSYLMLLLTRVALGAVSATAGPAVASLTGDSFPPERRARIYGYILSGELVGAAIGFLVSGELAGIVSWRVAFWVLAAPSLALAYVMWRHFEEPERGRHATREKAPEEQQTVRAEVVRQAEAEPREDLVLRRDPVRMSLWQASRYVLRIPTNVELIVASALGYFYFAGVRTFGVVYIRGWFGIGQNAATSALAVVGIGALVGVLIGGRLADRLVHRGHAAGRILVPAGFYLLAAVVFVPGLATTVLPLGIGLFALAGVGLSGANPPLDAARLDIMHFRLWGRAEGVRTVLQRIAVGAAPLLFGYVADALASGRNRPGSGLGDGFGANTNVHGLHIALLIMLVSLAAAAFFMLRARRSYPEDVATAQASERATRREPGGRVSRRPRRSRARARGSRSS